MILERLNQVAAADSAAVAIIDGAVSLSYGELMERCAGWAGLLKGRCEAGGIVAVSLPNCWQYPVCFFAIAGLGAICMPFNPQWRAAEVAWFVERLGIGLVITNSELRGPWDESGVAVIPVDSVDSHEPRHRLSVPDGSAPALYLTTSGSTGRPKIVPRTHANLLGGRDAVAAVLKVRRGSRFLSVVPLHHANGFANGMFLPLTSGGTMVIVRKALPAVVAEAVQRHGVEIVNMAPILYSLLAEHGLDRAAFTSVKAYLSSGAPLPAALGQAWREALDLPIRQLYGSSETGTICIEESESAMPGSVGRPVPTVEVRVLDGDGRPLAEGERGEIAVRGPAMMSGYVGEPELNETAFADGFFRMGDLGRIAANGELALDGRTKRWINSGGVKVDPVEVEQVIGRMPAVAQCKAGPGRGSRDIEVIAARIVLRPGAAVSRADVIAHCRQYLADYKIPRVIEFVESVPVDLAGKTPMEWLSK